MTRYTDRDCWAALICLAKAERAIGQDVGVMLPLDRRGWKSELLEFAQRLGVPRRSWNEKLGDTYYLDHSPMGGVRPVLMHSGESGEFTPQWWLPSAGLGPGSVPKKEFCMIVRAVGTAFEIAARIGAGV